MERTQIAMGERGEKIADLGQWLQVVQHVLNDTFLPRGKLLCSLPRELLGQTSKQRAAQVRG